MKTATITILLLLLLISVTIKAQYFDSEAGLFIGATSMQSDYGEKGHFNSSYGNLGFGIGAVYYISFNSNIRRWNDKSQQLKEHLRLKAEVSYMKTGLIHRGAYTEGTSAQTLLYNAMKGTSTTINYGFQLEYTIFNKSDDHRFEPYVSLGLLGNSNTPELESGLGNIETDPNLIPTVYNNGVFLEKTNSSSVTFGAGARIKSSDLNNKNSILIDFRWQRFDSDVIEGLKPTLDANQNKDYLLFLSIGYVFSLN